EEAQDKILAEILVQNGNKPFSAKEFSKSHQNLKLLATSNDKIGINFQDKALQYQYYQTKFVKRGLLLYNVLEYIWKQPKHSPMYCMLNELFHNSKREKKIKVLSIGGGPGNDSLGFGLFFEKYVKEVKMEFTLFDYEKTWRRYLPILKTIFYPKIVEFQQCNVTKSIIHNSINKFLKNECKEGNVFIFSYVCNETSARQDGTFYRELVKLSKFGSIFIFLDVIKYSK